jgi:PAS domain S-box-containing protein
VTTELADAVATLSALAGLSLPVDATAGPVPAADLPGEFAEVRYRTLIEQIPAVTFLASLAGGPNEIYVSPQIESLLGFTQQEWVSDPVLWYRQTHPGDRERVSEKFATLCLTGQPFRDEIRVLTRSGETVYVHAEARLVRDETGQLLFLQGVGFDVTEQARGRAAREELIREQAAHAEADRERDRLRDIFSGLPAAIWLLRRPDHVIEFMNPIARELARPGSDALAQAYAQAFPEFAAGLRAAFDDVFTTGAPVRVRELRSTAPAGAAERFFNVVCQPLQDYTGPLLLIHATEVTDQVRARHDVEDALRLRDEFLSIASHELKTPVTALQGQAQLVMRRFERTGEMDPARVSQALQAMTGQARKLARLIAHLLDISRLEAGKFTIEPEPTELSDLVQQVVANVRQLGQGRRIRLEATPRLAMVVDPLRLEQVLTNLLDNALKYSPEGGAVDVSLRALPDGGAELAVRDFGLGIPIEKRGQIFERFYQAHGDGHRSGLGLGLYISRQIVTLHGGSISAEFPADGGTRFVVRLPASMSA